MQSESAQQIQGISVLFVCLGNICRSPLAEGVFRAEATRLGLDARLHFDSAGTGGWHAGDPPDRRSAATAARHGMDISGQRARQLNAADFDRFDLILGMDRNNVANIRRAGSGRAKVSLFLDACEGKTGDIPDPYYGTGADFEEVYRMIRDAAASWFGALERRVSG